MKYINFSFADLRKACINEAKKINDRTNIDLIIFVERAGLPIALYMNEVFRCKTMGIRAERKAGKLKSIFFKMGGANLPLGVKNFLRLIELKSGIHGKHAERNVIFDVYMNDAEKSSFRNILVADDAVDTGASMLQVCAKVREVFPDSQIYTYALNVFSETEKLIKIDFCTVRDSIIRTPMSKDSEEYGEFLRMCSDYGLIRRENNDTFADITAKYFRGALSYVMSIIRKFTHKGGGHS